MTGNRRRRTIVVSGWSVSKRAAVEYSIRAATVGEAVLKARARAGGHLDVWNVREPGAES